MIYEQTKARLATTKKLNTAAIDQIAKEYLKGGVDITSLYPYLKESGAIHRIYFVVSLKKIKSFEAQLTFIEEHFAFLNDWWHVDLLLQLLRPAPSFEYVFNKAKDYVLSALPFVRRWGYVIFLSGHQKDSLHTKEIISLMKNDDAYYVQMGMAWLLADLAVYNPEVVLDYIGKPRLQYAIIGKAIQKICDSYRISELVKIRAKALRVLYKK